jgi:hypothetical protein
MASPIECQFSGFTLSPLSDTIGYGGLYNPLLFFPGLSSGFTNITYPLVSFEPFGLGNFGIANPFGTLSQLVTGSFNPFFGFSNLGFGFESPIGAFNQLGSSFFNPLALGNPATLTLGTQAGLSIGTLPLLSPISAPRIAAQTGSWIGTWQSTYIAFPILWNTGPMSLNIVEDPLLGVVAGTAILQDSRYASIPFEVSGVLVNDTITLEGFLGTGYDCILTCILTSLNTMTGFYTVLGTSIPVMDEGIFNLTLNPPVL